MMDEDILDDDSFLNPVEGDGPPPDDVCGCEDDHDLYDD